jgi:RNA polymerase sigma-70 factor, ECF subfamily
LTLEQENQNKFQSLDKNSFELIFRNEFRNLCLFAIRFVKDHDTSKEIVQDAFINLWEKRETIDLSRTVRSYLSSSVRNRCLNYLRDNKKFNRDILDAEDLLSDHGVIQNDSLEEDDLRQKITNAIDELPEKCREIFVLSRHENLKYQQIADKLGISVKTVETQMSKALQHMRIRLKDYIAIVIFLFYQ